MTFTLIAILITILLILLNGIFVAVEFAVVTSKKSKMQAVSSIVRTTFKHFVTFPDLRSKRKENNNF